MKALPFALSALFALVACRKSQTPSDAAPTTKKTAPSVLDSMVAEFSHGSALSVRPLEGDMVLSSCLGVSWVPAPGDGLEFEGTNKTDSVISVIVMDTALVPGEQIVLFSSAPTNYGCQGCQAKAGVLLKSDQQWTLARSLGSFGDNGRVGRPSSVVRLPDGRTLLAMESSQIGQGEFQAAIELLLLDPKGAHQATSILTSSDNAGACDSSQGTCWGNTVSVDWSRSVMPQKLSLKRQGTTREEDGTFRKLEDTTLVLDWKPAR